MLTVAGLLKALRLLGDEGRLRILRLLRAEELSVAELQEILGMGQSRISMQLAQLKQAGLVDVRRAGQKSLYHLVRTADAAIVELNRCSGYREIADAGAGRLEHSNSFSEKRKDRLAGLLRRTGRPVRPELCPRPELEGSGGDASPLLPPLVIADLGAGEATVSLLLAQRAERVIAVDSSPEMVEYGQEVARRNGVENLEYRLGDLEELPIEAGHRRPGAAASEPPPRHAPDRAVERSMANREARRPDCRHGSVASPVRRGARNVCRRLAGVLDGRADRLLAARRVQRTSRSRSCIGKTRRRTSKPSLRSAENGLLCKA